MKKKLTTILVTHSMEDALKYADYIIILNKGENIYGRNTRRYLY